MRTKQGFLILFFMGIVLSSLSALQVPPFSNYVVDQVGILNPSEENQLNSYLQALDKQGGVQMGVLIIKSLKGESLEDYSIKVTDQWKLGDKERDSGVLLLIAMNDKKIRLEVGYGLEGELTDAKSGLIIREIIGPAFRQGDFLGGILGAAYQVGKETSSVDLSSYMSAQPQKKSYNSGSSQGKSSIPFTFIVFIFVFLINSMGRRGRRGGGGLLRALFWGSLLSGRSGRDDHFGGLGGGGGFSGGSGGGFGGGGASGGW